VIVGKREEKRNRRGNENKRGNIAKASFYKGGGRRSLTEDLMDLDCAKGVKSSVSIDWRELHMNYTAKFMQVCHELHMNFVHICSCRRSVHIRYTYADSSFAKGAFGAFGGRKSAADIVLKFHGSSYDSIRKANQYEKEIYEYGGVL